jgi:hypothetical protein
MAVKVIKYGGKCGGTGNNNAVVKGGVNTAVNGGGGNAALKGGGNTW